MVAVSLDTITLSMPTTPKPLLSLIIPAYNEAERLPASLRQIHAFLSTQPFSAEIIVVENGSTDGTYEIVDGLKDQIPNLILLHEHTPGKGWAVRQGMLAARGEYRFICDADLSMPIEEVMRFLPPDPDRRAHRHRLARGARRGALR